VGGQFSSVELQRAVICVLYINDNGLDQRSVTGALNGFHLCSEWAVSVVVLR